MAPTGSSTHWQATVNCQFLNSHWQRQANLSGEDLLQPGHWRQRKARPRRYARRAGPARPRGPAVGRGPLGLGLAGFEFSSPPQAQARRRSRLPVTRSLSPGPRGRLCHDGDCASDHHRDMMIIIRFMMDASGIMMTRRARLGAWQPFGHQLEIGHSSRQRPPAARRPPVTRDDSELDS